MYRLALACLIPLVFLAVAEGLLRAADFHHLPREKLLVIPDKVSGFIGTREFHLDVAMAPPGYIWATSGNTEFTDRHGFRLPEVPFAKPEEKIRIAFLGGSTTQGGYRPYPERVVRLLNQVAGRDAYEALNVACSSYSTHQSLIALHRWVLPRKPDVVFVYHGWNDPLVAADGFADKRKDHLADAGGRPRLAMPDWMRNLRLTGLAAWLVDLFRPPWPEPRVAMDDITRNLEAMAEACADNGIRFIVMTRPGMPAETMVAHPVEAGSAEELHALAILGTRDPVDIYQRRWREVVAAQRAVTNRYPAAELFDGASVVGDLVDRAASGRFGENVPVFHDDNVHLYDFAEELLAQQIAMALAPSHAEAISNYTSGVVYLTALADELMREDAPREAAWCLREAMAQHPPGLQAILLGQMLAQAEEAFPFADLFRAGRWGSRDTDIDGKIAKLRRCLELRPHDFGIMSQIYRVCRYMQREDMTADAIASFQPRSEPEHILWLTATLESHVAGRRMTQARTTAAALLKMNPDDKLARSLMEDSNQ